MIIENIKSLTIIFLAGALILSYNKLSTLKTEIMQAEKQALEQSLTLKNKISEIEEQIDNEKEKHSEAIRTLRAQYADGLRLKSQNSDLRSASGAESSKNECGLSARDVGRLIDIAEKGQRAVNSLNQCVEQYNALKNLKKE